MNTSEQIGQLATALAAAQAEMQNATLNKENPHFRSRYADLASIRDAVVPPLAKQGIAVVQMTDIDDGAMLVRTRLIHKSGEWVEATYPITCDMGKPQAIGSCVTYARRYALAAICGIAAEEDDDGNEASKHGKVPVPSKAASRDIFSTLQAEIRGLKNAAEADEWKEERKAQLGSMPPDWKAELREQFTAHMAELKETANGV